MAKVLGESGRYVSQESVRKRRSLVIVALFGIGSICLLCGVTLGLSIQWIHPPGWVTASASLAALATIVAVGKWCLPKLDELEQEQINFRKGAVGEELVGAALERFPEEFRVINDLTTPYGNVDHVVVGPTGVFLLDTKNWRGVVSADKTGELLCNGKQLDKSHVRQFVGRVMGIRDKVKTLATGLDPYFQAVFVFTSARVDADWGRTRSLHCIRDEQLHDYIVESKRGQKLKSEEVERIAQAFLGLAHMDSDFTSKMGQHEVSQTSTSGDHVEHKEIRAGSCSCH
jgi:hypothetical protein